jgi:hypothetical protein
MPQGVKKLGARPGKAKANSAKVKQKIQKLKAKTKKGNPSLHGKDRIGTKQDFIEEKQLSKAIDQANEAKCAAKLLQSGGMLATLKDTTKKGKELNKEKRRSQVKKKVGRVEEKLKALQVEAEKKGLV